MKILTKAYYNESLEFQNGFEGTTGVEADGDPDDGWYLGGSGTQLWASYDNSSSHQRTGSKAISQSTSHSSNWYRAITAGKSFIMEGWFYWDTADPTSDLRHVGMQLDNGGDTDDAIFYYSTNKPDTAVGVFLKFLRDPGNTDYIQLLVYSRFSASPATYTTEVTLVKPQWYADKWIGIKLKVTVTGYELYSDYTDVGAWTLEAQGTWDNTATMENMDIFRFGMDDDGAAGEEAIIDDTLVSTLNTSSSEEIATLSDVKCSSSMGDGGVLNATKRDFELANYSTYSGYPWRHVEVYHHSGDTLKQKIWEGIILSPRINYKWIQFSGMTPLRILAEVEANYSSLLAEGEVTAVSGAVMTDANAAFTDTLLTKITTFTDDAGPTYELDVPMNTSAIYESDRTTPLSPPLEEGDYTDLATESGFWRAGEIDHPDFCMILTFDLPNSALSTGFEVEVITEFINSGTYATAPDIYVYDWQTPQWEKVSNLQVEDSATTFTFTDTDLSEALADYFDGLGDFKICIHAGAWSDPIGTQEYMKVYKAEVKNYYSTLFTAGTTKYTIDARAATTLTHTGQDIEADGVAINDRYKVGDYLHNIIGDIWDTAAITFVSIDYDDSTEIDSTDYNSDFVGPVLKRFADMDGRRVWDALGWQIKCKSSYEDTGIDLTEVDIETDINGNWTNGFYHVNGRNVYRKVKVFGAGVSYADTQSPSFNSLWTKTITDNRVPTQAAAANMVSKLLTKHSDAAKMLVFEIDMDGGITNIENLDIGKTIDVNLYSGTINITAGLITEIHYRQQFGGHLFAKLVVLVI